MRVRPDCGGICLDYPACGCKIKCGDRGNITLFDVVRDTCKRDDCRLTPLETIWTCKSCQRAWDVFYPPERQETIYDRHGNTVKSHMITPPPIITEIKKK